MKPYVATILAIATAIVLADAQLDAQQLVVDAPISAAAPPVAAASAGCAQTRTICVAEPKHNTKTVYSCKIEEYCLPRFSLMSLFGGKCSCEDGRCGDVRIKHRLVVKKVDAPDTTRCVPQLVPFQHAAPCISGASSVDPSAIQRPR
jgi:hypothetical protein